MGVEVEELSSSPHYRLLNYQSHWKKYAVVEKGERYLVTRFITERGDARHVTFLETFESWRDQVNELASLAPSIGQVERIVPHAEGIDVFERMPLGIPLGTLIGRSGALNTPFVASIMAELGRTLDTMLEAGISHLCLNPDRVILDEQGQMRLIDLGLVHLIQCIHGPLSFPNPAWEYIYPNPSYVPPEVLKGKVSGPETDIFSMAAMTFQLLTGSTAFVGADDMEVYSQIKMAQRPKLRSFRPEMGPRVEAAIYQALSPHQHERVKQPSGWVEEAFGAIDTLDDLKTSSARYSTLLNDWFYDAYFKTVAEPKAVDPLVAALLEKTDLNRPSQPLEHVFETMRSTRNAHDKSSRFVFYVTGFSVIFTVLALGLLYFFMRP